MQWEQTQFLGSKKDVYLTAEATLEHFKQLSLLSLLTPGILQPTPGIVLLLLLNHSTFSYLSKHIDMGVGGPLGLGFGGMLGTCQLRCTNRSAFQNFCSFWSSAPVVSLPDAGKLDCQELICWMKREESRGVFALLSGLQNIHTHTHTHRKAHTLRTSKSNLSMKPCMYVCESVHESLLRLQLSSSPPGAPCWELWYCF